MPPTEEQSNEERLSRRVDRALDEEDISDEPLSKKRKSRACDNCRRRKIKCDGQETSDRPCVNCVILKFSCTYNDTSKRRPPTYPDELEKLKLRVLQLEGLLCDLFPNANIYNRNLTAEHIRRSLLQTDGSLPSSPTSYPTINRLSIPAQDEDSSSDDNLPLLPTSIWERTPQGYHGRSSQVVFLSAACTRKRGWEVSPDSSKAQKTLEKDDPEISVINIANSYYMDNDSIFNNEPPPAFTFPPEDLMDSLIYLFFENIHCLFPILHRPTFKAQYRSKLHMQDGDFAMVLLLVCAEGSRYSQDERVLSKSRQFNEQDSGIWHHAGQDYFMQVYPLLVCPLARPPGLSDVQKFALASLYLQGSRTSYGWAFSGFGIRLGLEVGAHRKKRDGGLTVESQSWSRAFWALVTLDRLQSASTGRPWAIQDEDIDVDFPLAIDDEYWDPPDPKDAWKQPPGKPSMIDNFRAMLKLTEILTFALRTVYSNNKTKQMLGLVGSGWEQRVVSEIDSALNKWIDAIPDHLRWNPHQENIIFFNQSAVLNCMYYYIQILVHRPFIPLATASSSLSFPSLAICTNAARSCSHILDIQRLKGGSFSPMISCAFTSGIVLLLNIWGVKKHSVRADPGRHMQDVFKCMQWLKATSKRWGKARLAEDILGILLSAGDFPQPHTNPILDSLAGTKRPRTTESQFSNDKIGTRESPAALNTYIFTRHDPSTSQTQPMIPLPSFSTEGALPIAGINGFLPMDRPFTSADLSYLPMYPELSYVDGAGTIPTTTAIHQSYKGTDIPLGEETAQGGREGSSLSQIGPSTSQFGSSPSSDSEIDPIQPGALADSDYENMNTILHTYPEVSLGNDTLSMWATAPMTFETLDWDRFAQDFQLQNPNDAG